MALRKDGAVPGEVQIGGPHPRDLQVEKSAIQGKVTATEGKFGEAYEFEEGSIEIGGKEEHAIGEESFTLSLWFTRDPKSVDDKVRRLISAGAGSRTGKPGWALWISGKGDALTFAVSDGKQRVENITAKDESLASGEWRHAAVTVDRENGKAVLFLDGQLVNETALPFSKGEKIESASGLSIGKNSDGSDHHRGKIDEVAIWNRLLLPEEIEEVYEGETGLGAVFNAEAD
jgi:hypothetical protein